MNRLPKITQLNNFRSVIKHGSFRAAALASHQTQSAITRSIQELELILGAPLFLRGTQGIELTHIGKVFEPKVSLIINELEKIVGDISHINGVSGGNISIGCSHFPAFAILPEIIKKFQNSHPATRLTITEGQFSELVIPLRTAKLDFFIGIISEGISTEGFKEENIFKSEFYVFGKKNHPLNKSKSIFELRNANWFLPGPGTSIFNSLENLIFPHGKGPQCAVLYGDSITLAQQLILGEGYLSCGPKEIINSPFLKGKIELFDIQEPLPCGYYSIIQRPESASNEIVEGLIKEIRWAFLSFSD